MSEYQEFKMWLHDAISGLQLPYSGQIKVCATGTKYNCAVYNTDGTLQTGSRATVDFSSGLIQFRTLQSVGAVDIYIYTNRGYYAIVRNVQAGEVGRVNLDTANKQQTLIYPFSADDSGYADATKIDTGIDFCQFQQILPYGLGVLVTDVASAVAIDVGTEAASVEDDDGFIDGLLLTTATFVPAVVGYTVGTNSVYADLTGGTQEWTLGALFHPATTKGAKAEGTDSATTKNGFYIIKLRERCSGWVISGAERANNDVVAILFVKFVKLFPLARQVDYQRFYVIGGCRVGRGECVALEFQLYFAGGASTPGGFFCGRCGVVFKRHVERYLLHNLFEE